MSDIKLYMTTSVERKTFETSHVGMRMSWTETFDQLAEYLEA